MATVTETLQSERDPLRAVCRKACGALRGHEGLEYANANLVGDVTLTWDEERDVTDAILAALARSGFRGSPRQIGNSPLSGLVAASCNGQGYGRPVSEPEPDTEARRIAKEARDRARFEEEALSLADQVYRVARRLVGSREEAEDLVQETYARAFRSWRSFTPGHEHARLAAAYPHKPECRPRPQSPAHSSDAAARGDRLLPREQARIRRRRGGARDGRRSSSACRKIPS